MLAFGNVASGSDGGLVNGVSVLIEEESESSLPSSFLQTRTQREDSYEPGREPSPGTGSDGVLIVRFQPPEL